MTSHAYLNDHIGRLRRGTLRLQAAAGATIRVQQRGHAFEFGTPLSGAQLREEPELDAFTSKWFNAGVVPVKWAGIERERGQRRYEHADATLDWCEEHDFAVRGHCLFYAHRIHVQDWVKAIADDGELRRCIERQARETVARYRGRIPEYDLNNELLDGSWYRDRLGNDILRRMADWVLEEDPKARLYVNEHDILTGGDIDRYVELIDHLLTIGVPIRGIGCQGHLDPPFDLSHVERVLDRLAQFGLPIKITESDCGIRLKEERYRGVPWIEGSEKDKDLEAFRRIVDGYPDDFEEQKGRALDHFYRLAFAHPAVHGLYLWGFQEGRHWRTRGEAFRADLTPLPAGAAYCGLVGDEWLTTATVQAGADGFAAVRAFYGPYRITAGDRAVDTELRPDTEAAVIALGP